MNYYNEIKEKLLNNEVKLKVKEYSINRTNLETYFEVGKLLSEAGKHYGEGIIKNYSVKLTKELGKKYSSSLLYKILQFYNICKKVPTMSGNLSWSHWYELLSIKNSEKIKYYISISENDNLTVRELRSRIKSKEYERLDEEVKNKLMKHEEAKVSDFIKNPIIIKNRNNIDINKISEKVLKEIILEDISSFMKELGNGFCYIDNEYKIKLGDRYNYIDILLYNIKYKCYVVVELKVTELKKEYIGQIKLYMNYIDKNLKEIEDNKTIGIIICKKDNLYVMEYCSDKRIFNSTYALDCVY